MKATVLHRKDENALIRRLLDTQLTADNEKSGENMVD
jgi:hypothetical protein